MTLNQARFIKEAIQFSGEDCNFCLDYSGRGMMGRTTVGVIIEDESGLLSMVVNYIKENFTEIKREDIPDFDSFRRENMGRKTILY